MNDDIDPGVGVQSARGRPRSEVLHAEILWAATRLFSRKGTALASTREIASMAGTTERTLFAHFRSKQGLISAVIDEAVLAHLVPTSLEDLTKLIASYNGNFREWHAALLRSRLAELLKRPELTRMLLGELLTDEAQRERFVKLWRPAVWEPIKELFVRLQQQGSLRADVGAADLASQFLRVNISFLVSRILDPASVAAADEGETASIALVFHSGTSRPAS